MAAVSMAPYYQAYQAAPMNLSGAPMGNFPPMGLSSPIPGPAPAFMSAGVRHAMSPGPCMGSVQTFGATHHPSPMMYPGAPPMMHPGAPPMMHPGATPMMYPGNMQSPFPAASVDAVGAHGSTASPAKSGVLLCIGDSLTAGRSHTTDTYPANLDAILQQDGYSFNVKNEGIYAETSDALLRRLQHAIANASRFGPIAYILVLTGTNDILQFRSPSSILENLHRIHALAASAPGSPCVGTLTVPKCRLFRPEQEQMRLAVNAGIKEFCKMPSRMPKFLVDLEPVSVDLAEDGVHYLGQGYKEFAQHASHAIRQLL